MNIKSNEILTLYKQTGQFFHSLAYGAAQKKLAILQASLNFSGALTLLSLDEEFEVSEIKQATLQPPKSLSYYLWGEMSWHPHEEHLLVAHAQSLFEINLEGEMTELPVPTYQTIYDPVYHPDGKRIAATLGIADFDITQLTWQNDIKPSPKFETLFRSTLSEGAAQYQPNGEGIAFLSKRSGIRQLWFAIDDELKQLTQFTKQERIQSFIWSSESNQLLVNVNNQLQLISTSGDREPLNNSPIVLNIYQWLMDGSLLLKVANGEQANIVRFDINTGNIEALYHGETRWAQLYENENDHQPILYISDYKGLLTELPLDDKKQSSKLAFMSSYKKFFIQSNTLITMNKQGYIYCYDLISGNKKKLELGIKLQKLNDIDLQRRQLLYKRYVSGKKEIVIIE